MRCMYLYTVGLLNPHTLASSDTFSVPAISSGIFQFSDLAIDILFILIGAASGI